MSNMSDMGNIAEMLKLFFDWKESRYISQYAACSFVTLMLWDQLLTIKDEVEFVFNSSFRAITVLWYWNRYIAPILLIFKLIVGTPNSILLRNNGCLKFYFTMAITYTFSIAGTTWLLIMIVVALWDYSKWIKFFLQGLFGAVYISVLALTIIIFRGINMQWDPMTEFCIIEDSSIKRMSMVFTTMYSLLALLDFIIFTLTVVRVVRIRQNIGGGRALISTLLRDGIVRFFLVFALHLAGLIVFAIGLTWYGEMTWTGTWAFMTMIFSRLFLSMRKAASQKTNTYLNTTTDGKTAVGPSQGTFKPKRRASAAVGSATVVRSTNDGIPLTEVHLHKEVIYDIA